MQRLVHCHVYSQVMAGAASAGFRITINSHSGEATRISHQQPLNKEAKSLAVGLEVRHLVRHHEARQKLAQINLLHELAPQHVVGHSPSVQMADKTQNIRRPLYFKQTDTFKAWNAAFFRNSRAPFGSSRKAFEVTDVKTM